MDEQQCVKIWKESLNDAIDQLGLAMANLSEASCYEKWQAKLAEVSDEIAMKIFDLQEIRREFR